MSGASLKRSLVSAMAALAVASATGCGNARPSVSSTPAVVHGISADLPPAPETWPAYPHVTRPSCWARPQIGGGVSRINATAPTYLPPPPRHPIAPTAVARRLLARLGDRRYVRSISFVPAPRAVGGRVRALYAGGHPPLGALKAEVHVPAATPPPGDRMTPAETLRYGVADFEGEIVGDALRDDLCDAGGGPLTMWGTNGSLGFAESSDAVDQRFPNPSPAAFQRRVALVGQRYGFTVASLRLLRPRDIVPVLIVKTDRPRKAFVKDIGKITDLLDPRSYSASKRRSAETFEAFFFAVEDARGPFAFVQSASRNESESGEWAVSSCLYPYPTQGPTGGPPCS